MVEKGACEVMLGTFYYIRWLFGLFFLAFEVDESPLRLAEESAWAVVDAVVVGYDLVAAA